MLDVGCGVGGPAREIAKFTGAHVTGLNNNDYQIERATHYAAKEGLSNQTKFVKGDFMVRAAISISLLFILHSFYYAFPTEMKLTRWEIANGLPGQQLRRCLRY